MSQADLQIKSLAVNEAILKRRSIHHFTTQPIAPDVLKQLLTLTIAAPSSWNLQDWSIVLVQDEAQKQALSQAAWGQQQIVQAPVTFVFVANTNATWEDDVNEIYDIARQRGAWPEERIAYLQQNMPAFQAKLKEAGLLREYAVKDAIIGATHLVLAAEGLGLATSMMNGWLEDKVKEVIGIADKPELAIALVVVVGYAQETPVDPGRLPLSKRVFVGGYNVAYSE